LKYTANQGRAEMLGQLLAQTFADHRAVFSRRFFAAAIEAGTLLRPIGNTVYFMPPYVMEKAELRTLVAIAAAALDKALR
jgi:adenosylmethionine-8-amino-7-oxononanoate aminotransferase